MDDSWMMYKGSLTSNQNICPCCGGIVSIAYGKDHCCSAICDRRLRNKVATMPKPVRKRKIETGICPKCGEYYDGDSKVLCTKCLKGGKVNAD